MENCALTASHGLPEMAQKDRKGMWIFGESDSKRRVIYIEKRNGSYGFTLQSYGVRYKHGNRETDFITYVNAVEKDGSAYGSGLREGDVILSINGTNMARVEHKSLVSFIRKCPSSLKMVVVSDERARKVELHMRYVHLQKKLHDKMKELESLNWQEKELMAKICKTNLCTATTSTTTCCFCPIHKSSTIGGSTKEKSSKNLEKENRKQSLVSGSVGDPSSIVLVGGFDECSRKSQSSRDLQHHQSGHICPGGPGPGQPVNVTKYKDISSSTGSVVQNSSNSKVVVDGQFFNSLHHYKKEPPPIIQVGRNDSISSACFKDKPKSWDNLMTTRAYGGYGYGYGYGYFPQKPPGGCSHSSGGGHGTTTTTTTGHSRVIHPHHHNHHSHCIHSHANHHYKTTNTSTVTATNSSTTSNPPPQGVIYANLSKPQPQLQLKQSEGVQTDFYTRPSNTISTGTGTGKQKNFKNFNNSDNFSVSSRMERTLSDSSLNSDHHQSFPKNMTFSGNKHHSGRSSENVNVRYASDEDYDTNGIKVVEQHHHGHGQGGHQQPQQPQKTKRRGNFDIFV